MAKGHLDVITEDLTNHPQCKHGPTILFSREMKGERRNFFACSACRERKHCNFFLWVAESQKISGLKRNAWEQERLKYIQNINHRKKFLTLNKIISLSPDKRIYCKDCSDFVLDRNKPSHTDHGLIRGLTDYQLNHPSEFLTAAADAKKEAQYLFSKSSVETIINIFQDLNYKNVICIGTPRIHEYIKNNCDRMNSILLDIDKRFHNFFGPLEYIWYNSFNHHFFFKETKDIFTDFLKQDEGKYTVVITDPPFGGRVEPLAYTLNTINREYKTVNNLENDVPIFWIFPYFMEPQIMNSLPNFKMLDYKVLYENHSSFQNGPKGRKQGSPVRIFTNVDPTLISLPEDEYKYCKFCKKWVSEENRHCHQCNSCTSKDGRTYIHCEICKRCVKPTWKHCTNCGRCTQLDHKCMILKFTKKCFNCDGQGHKKSECPQVNNPLKQKGKKSTKVQNLKKKKKLS